VRRQHQGILSIGAHRGEENQRDVWRCSQGGAAQGTGRDEPAGLELLELCLAELLLLIGEGLLACGAAISSQHVPRLSSVLYGATMRCQVRQNRQHDHEENRQEGHGAYLAPGRSG
jgi:hypothetical protein